MGKKLGIGLIAVVAAAGVGIYLKPQFTVNTPEYQRPGKVVEVDQGWDAAKRQAFHHTPQGTRLLPRTWFLSLEQPCLSLGECGLLRETEYLGRFGFLASGQDEEWNPDGLPVGFAVDTSFEDPATKEKYPVVGLTCAACHTGELHYQGTAVRIEGGPAMADVTEFQKAIGLAFAFTKYIPGRYGRFERRVLGEGASEADKQALRARFDGAWEMAKAELETAKQRKLYENSAGFARTDALTRIGNQVFGVDMENAENLAPANAPVRFPQIWDASWFTWVQYNYSIADPMVRNVGEALGVRAAAKLSGPDAAKFANSVNVEGLWKMEEMLAGPGPYQGLRSPKWPSVFGALDEAKRARGEALYREHCIGCHLPPVAELIADLETEKPRYWRKNSVGRSFLNVTAVDMEHVGTDPRQAADFMARTADTGSLGKGRVSAAAGLELVTKSIRDNYYDKRGFDAATRLAWNGFRAPEDPMVQAPARYKARPLNGIWAVAPYLHNGSVPNLYLVLSPLSERPASFWLGSKEFDPVRVGYTTEPIAGGYEYKTSVNGNSNQGHRFEDGPRGKGIIGPALAPEERWAIIEFLKSL
jgi:hypothetical protein